MFKKTIALLISTSMLSACYGFRGPTPVLSASGVVSTDRGAPREGPYFLRFRALALRAAGCTESAAVIVCADAEVNDPALMRRYMLGGFMLVRHNCNEYFDTMGRHQGRSRVARDLLAPIAALITGILSLRNLSDGDEQEWLTRLSLGTGAATSALDIIDRRFLFGSDNIASVKQMIMRALATQATEALRLAGSPGTEPLTFELASTQILENQNICTPPEILRRTRESIQNAPVAPTTQPGGKPPETRTATPQGLTPSEAQVPPPRR